MPVEAACSFPMQGGVGVWCCFSAFSPPSPRPKPPTPNWASATRNRPRRTARGRTNCRPQGWPCMRRRAGQNVKK